MEIPKTYIYVYVLYILCSIYFVFYYTGEQLFGNLYRLYSIIAQHDWSYCLNLLFS